MTRAPLWLGLLFPLLVPEATAAPLETVSCVCEISATETPEHVAVSPDGRHVYFGLPGAIVGRQRNATSGLYAGAVPTPGVFPGMRKSAFSPDGLHLYVVADPFDAIYVLARTPLTGALAATQVVSDGAGGVDGLGGVRDVAVSPDGRHVYAVAEGDDAIAAFARNAVTGQLAFVEFERDGVAAVDGMDGAYAVAVSPDGRHVYVASRSDDAVAVFARNVQSGALAFLEDRRDGVAGFDGLDGASDVVVARDGRGVFVLGSAEDAIAVLAREPVSGSLAFVEVESGLFAFETPRALALDPLRPRLFALSEEGPAAFGGIRVFDYDSETARLAGGYLLGIVGADLAAVPDGRFLYVVGGVLGTGAVPPVAIAPLRFADLIREGERGVEGLGFPADLAAYGGSLYAISSGNANSLAVFAQDGATLDFVEAFFSDAGGVPGLFGADGVAVSADGRHVYVTSGGSVDAVTLFARNPATGRLAFVETIYDGIGGVDGLDGADGIALSGDGAHVYVASAVDDAVAVFARHAPSGTLTQVEVQRDGVGVVDGLDGATALALSPDGENLYVSGRNDDAVAVFAREPGTGALAFVEREALGVGGVVSMDDPFALAVTPDGRHVYVAARESDAIVRFGRALSNGALTFGAALVDPVDLAFPNDVALSPDGRLLFAIGGFSHRLIAYWRDPDTGGLGLAQREADGVLGVDGLDSPAALLARGRHVYVTSLGDESIAVFVPEPAGAAAGACALALLVALAARRRRGAACCGVALAALAPAPARAVLPIEVDFASFGAYTATAFAACRMSAGSDVSLGPGGLGVDSPAGVFSADLDGAEELVIAFSPLDTGGASRVSYRVSTAGNQNGTGPPGEAFLEAFAPGGASLGVRAVSGVGTVDVSALFSHQRIQFLEIAASVDSQRIESVTFRPAKIASSYVSLQGLGTVQTPSFEVCDLTITGSHDVRLAQVGLGIASADPPSLLDSLLEGAESVRFDFERPQTAVAYANVAVGDQKANGILAESFVEGFGAAGASLGLVAVSGEGLHQVTPLFGGAPLSGFRVLADIDAQRIEAVLHVPEPDGGTLALGAAVALALVARVPIPAPRVGPRRRGLRGRCSAASRPARHGPRSPPRPVLRGQPDLVGRRRADPRGLARLRPRGLPARREAALPRGARGAGPAGRGPAPAPPPVSLRDRHAELGPARRRRHRARLLRARDRGGAPAVRGERDPGPLRPRERV